MKIESEQLKQACKASQARWAVWLVWVGHTWRVTEGAGLTRPTAQALARLVESGELATWLSGTLGNGRARNRGCSQIALDKHCSRLYAFPNPALGTLLLVGGPELTKEAQSWFKILAAQPVIQPGLEEGFKPEPARKKTEKNGAVRNHELVVRMLEQLFGLYDEAEIAQKAAKLVVQHFNCDYGGLYMRVAGENKLTVLDVAGLQADITRVGIQIDTGEGIVGRMFRSKQLEYCPSGECASFVGLPAGSDVCAPLCVDEECIGLLHLHQNIADGFSVEALAFLKSFAKVLAMVILNARQNHELQLRVRQLQVARDSTLDLISDLDLSSILKRIVQRARKLTQASWAILGLLDETRQHIRPVVAEPAWLMDGIPSIPMGAGLVGQVAASGAPLNVLDYQDWPDRIDLGEWLRFSAVLGVPLKWQGEVIGVLAVLSDQPGQVFGADELEILELLAPKIAVSIRNARLYQEVQDRIAAEQRAEQRILQAARLAAVGELAAGVAHELNNPLTTVTGFVELALEDLPDELPQRNDLLLVLEEARRAQGVVKRLLDFARQSENLRSMTSINDLIENVRDLIHHKLESQDITLKMDLALDLPLIFVDPNQIKQVLLNLCQNALQAMTHGGALQLTSRQTLRDGKAWLKVEVSDTGVGITPENQIRLFEPFFTTRPVGEGTGLGLSVSYGLVADHGGFMDFSSEAGKGSCFSIHLPLAQGEPNA